MGLRGRRRDLLLGLRLRLVQLDLLRLHLVVMLVPLLELLVVQLDYHLVLLLLPLPLLDYHLALLLLHR